MKAYVRLNNRSERPLADAKHSQVRGKKNLVIEKSLAGPIGIFVKFSTLQDHGVDKVFFLENDNVDASQKNVIFLARGEKANKPIAVAGMYVLSLSYLITVERPCLNTVQKYPKVSKRIQKSTTPVKATAWDHKVDCVDIPYSTRSVLIPKLIIFTCAARSIAFSCGCIRFHAIITG